MCMNQSFIPLIRIKTQASDSETLESGFVSGDGRTTCSERKNYDHQIKVLPDSPGGERPDELLRDSPAGERPDEYDNNVWTRDDGTLIFIAPSPQSSTSLTSLEIDQGRLYINSSSVTSLGVNHHHRQDINPKFIASLSLDADAGYHDVTVNSRNDDN